MPQIIVTAGPGRDVGDATVMLRERVNATDFESERFAANLLERLGWAVSDATEVERQGTADERDMLELVSPEPHLEPDPPRTPEPAGIA